MKRKKIISLLLCIVLIAGCAPIKPYTLTPILPDKDNIYVTIPATDNMRTQDAAFANQWERTINFCNQRLQSLSTEIDDRNSRLSKTSNYTLLIGGLAGLATTIYAGVVSNPKKEVIIPLGAISGTSLVSALPALNSDARLDQLKEKYNQIKSYEKQAIALFNQIEQELVKLGLIENRQKKLDDATKTVPPPANLASLNSDLEVANADWQAQQIKLEDLFGKARAALNNWEFELR